MTDLGTSEADQMERRVLVAHRRDMDVGRVHCLAHLGTTQLDQPLLLSVREQNLEIGELHNPKVGVLSQAMPDVRDEDLGVAQAPGGARPGRTLDVVGEPSQGPGTSLLLAGWR